MQLFHIFATGRFRYHVKYVDLLVVINISCHVYRLKNWNSNLTQHAHAMKLSIILSYLFYF